MHSLCTLFSNPNNDFDMQLYENPSHSEYSEQVVIHKNEVDSSWQNKNTSLATIGMRRKGIAIAYIPKRSVNYVQYSSTYYLVNKDNEVIFELNTEYKETHFEYYNNRIYRTIKGFYIIEYNGLEIRNRVGRDDQEFDYTGVEVLDENGDKVPSWDKNEIGIDKECNYMGYGIFEFENTFYNSESLEKLFSIPSKFHIDTIFENAFAQLSVNQSFEFAVIVKDKNIIEQSLFTDLENIKDKYEKAERLFLKKMHYSHQKTENLENSANHYIDKYGYELCANGSLFRPYGEEIFVSKKNYIESYGNFEKINSIDSADISILNAIKTNLQTYQNTHKRRILFRLDKNINIYIYQDVYILTAYTRKGKLYSFFNTDGHKISRKLYIEGFTQLSLILTSNLYESSNNMVSFEKITDINNMIFLAKDINYEQYIVRFEKGTLIESALSIKEELKEYHMTLEKGYIKFRKSNVNTKCKVDDTKYFDYDMNPLKVNYINCHIKTEINNYLYSLKEKFISSYGGCFSGYNGELIFYPNKPKLTWINGVPTLPFPKSYESCNARIDILNSNRENDVASIEKIKTYLTEEGIFYLYKFVCKPHGYCDRFGNLYYKFNPYTVKF